jgi:hypothetical protein
MTARPPCSPVPLFSLGQVVATVGAIVMLTMCGVSPQSLLRRHQQGDWGDVPSEDAKENEVSVFAGLRILSSYQISAGVRIWIITEADRSVTTLLLPEEY